ncbi:MAG TPA: RING finger protein [Oscillospiraceae bacterium]|nr:RING finger protein [Oscillospiraceae bacterium]HPF56067.1 RING finger protein [Clostridiales bacterium]HPK36403.1 RING finger protein [Oscillospiraceae bacterium]HPR76527.1 RING finger protein [Oscillospiraceae bacterium]
MNTFAGKTCPYCKTEFAADDDIVVCSECGMPHHRECWVENQGCSTFGCSGTIQGVGSVQPESAQPVAAQYEFERPISAGSTSVAAVIAAPPTAVTVRAKFCPKCGAKREEEHLFCSECGYRFVARESTVSSAAATAAIQNPVYQGAPDPVVTMQEMYFKDTAHPEAKYIVRNVPFYLEKFKRMRLSDTIVSWNWPAMLVTPYWCMYRKMYGIGAAFVVGAIALAQWPIYGFIILLVTRIVFAIFANYIYMKRIQVMIIKEEIMDESLRPIYVMNHGGINTGAAIAAAIVLLIINIIIAYN